MPEPIAPTRSSDVDSAKDASSSLSRADRVCSPRPTAENTAAENTAPENTAAETTTSGTTGEGTGLGETATAPDKSEAAAQTLRSQPASPDLTRAWAPLAIPAYRSFWIAGLVSNFGTWMHETGAVWLMTSLEPRPEMVSAVRTCMTIPVFCLALPAGVWADRIDRRQWLITTQLILFAVATAMTVLALLEMINPTLLLVLTAAMGVGMILNLPAWQATTPELVPPALVPSAVAVGSISFNLARSVGPALAGLIIAQLGIWVPFAFNAISFLAVVFVVSRWQSTFRQRRRKRASSFFDELRKGVLVVGSSREIRNTLARIFLFSFPASILWSLLSLVSTEKLGFQERGFGACLGLIGTGAVVGAWFLPRLRLRFSSESIVLASQLCYAIVCGVIGISRSAWVILPVLLAIGACWMSTMTTLNATAQVYLRRKYRARGMATFIMSFSLGMASGSAAWGWIGHALGIGPAFLISALVMTATALSTFPLKIGTLRVAQAG